MVNPYVWSPKLVKSNPECALSSGRFGARQPLRTGRTGKDSSSPLITDRDGTTIDSADACFALIGDIVKFAGGERPVLGAAPVKPTMCDDEIKGKEAKACKTDYRAAKKEYQDRSKIWNKARKNLQKWDKKASRFAAHCRKAPKSKGHKNFESWQRNKKGKVTTECVAIGSGNAMKCVSKSVK